MSGNQESHAILNHQLLNASRDNQFVTFQVGDEFYGIEIMIVQEIIRYKKPTRVFNALPVIKGVINFRGDIIPIIDMNVKFRLPQKDYDEYTVVIVVEVKGKTMGIIVDRISDILTFEKDKIKVVDDELAEDMKTNYLRGLVETKDRVVMLLDPNMLLSFDELKKVVELTENGPILVDKGEVNQL
ncbi:chemotaxis protein CheW [Bacillaceae bacterium IKA-2]|jgi:purine-binding chemotaxis protein CheW|nr:chemotaxis protein CheW [Bacillaceae bacterium IKA-2]